MTVACIHFQETTRPHALSLQMALSGHGLPSLAVEEGFVPQGGSPSQYAARHGGTLLFLINPRLEDLCTTPGMTTAALYTCRYGRSPSRQVMAWHEAHGVPALWERIPSRVAGHPWAWSIMLPPLPSSLRHDNTFARSRGPRPHVSSMRPPLEPEEARALQRDYLRVKRRRTELVLVSALDSLDNLAHKTAATDLWYLPAIPGGCCPWSLELSTILALGGPMAASLPPQGLENLIALAATYDVAEEIALAGSSGGASPETVHERITCACLDTLDRAGLLRL